MRPSRRYQAASAWGQATTMTRALHPVARSLLGWGSGGYVGDLERLGHKSRPDRLRSVVEEAGRSSRQRRLGRGGSNGGWAASVQRVGSLSPPRVQVNLSRSVSFGRRIEWRPHVHKRPSGVNHATYGTCPVPGRLSRWRDILVEPEGVVGVVGSFERSEAVELRHAVGLADAVQPFVHEEVDVYTRLVGG